MSASNASGVARNRRAWRIFLIVGALATIAIGLVAAAGFYSYSIDPPEFPSLQDDPDASLGGTVAFFADGCVRVTAASGAAERELVCLEESDGNGPQLAWRDDGRLEITTFDWPTDGELEAGSQQLVDVATGEIEEVAEADLPDTPERTPVPAVGPDGEEVTATREVSGWPVQRSQLTVTIREDGDRRTLMSGSGNPDYGVALGGAPVWSPSGDWIVMIDGRLLLITTDENPQTRVLVESPSGIGSWASAGIRTFAATDADLLPTDE